MLLKIAAMGSLLILTLAGCSKSTSPVSSAETTPAVTITPADGQADVRLDAAIALQFAKPADPAVVERGFHLISQRDMADSLCPYSTKMDHTDMMTAMTDTGKMHHLDSAHATRGTFSWNSGNTLCTFRPDSMMRPRMGYMVHMGEELVVMMEQTMGGMQGMTGHGQGMMSNDMMYHFTTLDTTTTGGGGHGGHH